MEHQQFIVVTILLIFDGLISINCNLANDGVKVVPLAGKVNHNRDPKEATTFQRPANQHQPHIYGQGHLSINPNVQSTDHKNSYNLLSEAMTQAVSNEFSSVGSGSADGSCHVDDMECYNSQDRLSMEAIRALHKQLDDDDNGNIDLSESDDFLREELKYDSGYEKRQKAFHFNDDMHISVKELWEAWLRSEVHNWTIEQTTDWLAQSVQLPQYVEVFKLHKVTGAALPRLAVNTMHYLSNVLGIKDPIHKQKIALKAMDVVLFGPPRETGTRWKDYILVTLLLSAIIGCWYAYQQSKNAKLHLRRMAQDMEGLQRAEQSLQEMQKELERARMEQENVASEKMDLERRLKEAPSISSSNSDLEVQQLKKEIEMLRSELSRAEIELVDNCWAPPPQLQQWLQYTYELENKNHQKKRVAAEKQLQSAREACEKLRKKRTSFVGAFVSTHGKSIDDVDRSIVEARNSLGEVTNELQERLHRWKQIETCLGFNIVNNNGLTYLENVLYGRNGALSKGSRGRITSSTDDLDEDSIQGLFDTYSRSSGLSSSGIVNSGSNMLKDDSSCSDEGADVQSVHFYLGSTPSPSIMSVPQMPSRFGVVQENTFNHISMPQTQHQKISGVSSNIIAPICNFVPNNIENKQQDENSSLESPSLSDCSVTAPPRLKKQSQKINSHQSQIPSVSGKIPLPPPRKSNQNPLLRSQSTDMMIVPLELQTYFPKIQSQKIIKSALNQSSTLPLGTSTPAVLQTATIPNNVAPLDTKKGTIYTSRIVKKVMTKQYSASSQQSTSSTSSSLQSAPSAIDGDKDSSKESLYSDKNPETKKLSSPDVKLLKETNFEKTKLLTSNDLPFFDNLAINPATTFSKSSATSLSEKESISDNALSNPEVGLKKRKRRLRFPFGGQNSINKKDVF